VPRIPTSGAVIYVYYGNPSAINRENGDEVFEFFDDFNGNALDTTKWNRKGNGTFSVSGGELSTIGEAAIYSTASIINVTNKYVELRGKLHGTSGNDVEVGFGNITSSGLWRGNRNGEWITAIGWDNKGVTINDGVGTENCLTYSAGSLWDSTGYFVYRVKINTNRAQVWKNGALVMDQTATCRHSLSSAPVLLVLDHYPTTPNYTQYVDWVFVRKYASTEPSASLGSEEKAPGPVAYWKFDEGYGDTLQDSTGNNNDGTRQGTTRPEWKQESDCIAGKCLYFDGSTSYATATSNRFPTGSSPRTIQAWIKPITSTSEWKDIIYWGTNASNQLSTIGIPNRRFSFGGYANDCVGSTTVPLNKWTHVVATYDGNVTIKLYLNGVLDKTCTLSQPLNTSSGSTVYIGKRHGFFHGYIDEVKIYPYARSAAQIKADYLAGLHGGGSSTGLSAVLGSTKEKAGGVNLSDGLVGYWKFDESSWTNDCSTSPVTDASGNGNHGKACPASTGPTGGAAGKFGNAGSFDESDDYVTINESGGLNPSNTISVSAWIYPTSSGNMHVVGRQTGYLLWIQQGYANFEVNLQGSSSWCNPHDDNPSGNTAVPLNQWSLLTGVYDGSEVRVYLNGKLVNYANSSHDPNGCNGNVINHSGSVTLGARSSARYFSGKIDEVRIYNRALSPREVRALYEWAPGPVGYWKFDEKTGTTAYDASGNGNHASISNGGWTNGKFGGAFDNTNNGSYASITQTSVLNPTNPGLTVEAWVYVKEYIDSAINHWQTIVEGSGNLNQATGYYLGFVGSGTLFTWRVGNGSSYDAVINVSETTIPLNQWVHVAGVLDSSKAYLYVNGVLVATDTHSLGSISYGSYPISIGALSYGLGSDHNLHGYIDEVRIYNYARTQKQIIEDMNAGHPIGGSPVGSQVLYLKFDEGYGTTIHDSSPQGNNGNLGVGTSAPSWTNSGKFGKALQFDGSNDYAEIPADSSLNIGSGNLTISFWIKAPSQGGTKYILDRRHTGTGYDVTLNSNGTVTFYFRTNVSQVINVGVTSTGTVDDNNWHHVAFVLDRTTSSPLYIDGKLDNCRYLGIGIR